MKPAKGLFWAIALVFLVHNGQALRVKDFRGKNVVLFLSDQERYLQHFPVDWMQKNLPGMTRLVKHGLSFKNAMTNSCMCSPARTTFLTGYLPAQHGVRYTLEPNMPADQYPQVEMPLPDQIPNLGTVMTAAGYEFVYKGKIHTFKPANGKSWEVSDGAAYFGPQTSWNPPDAGANQDLSESGGPPSDNDVRIIEQYGNYKNGTEGALQYIQERASAQQPFFLVVSVVNPHDVLFYPRAFNQSYVNETWLQGDLTPPSTFYENIMWPNKPAAQYIFKTIMSADGFSGNATSGSEYLNFYGNLLKYSDNNLVKVLNALESKKLLGDTIVIRTADHGEMGLAHGGMRQKNFNFYEESLRVPMIYSNPKLFPKPVQSSAMISHVDFVPTMANLFGAPAKAKRDWQGKDYTKVLLNPTKKVQDYIIFTYDDYQAGQASGPYVKAPQHIVAIRESRWKLAKYYDPKGSNVAPQYEMYDLVTDPAEKTNLASPVHKRTAAQEQQFIRLRKRLEEAVKNRLAPLPLKRSIDLNATATSKSTGGNKITEAGRIGGIPIGKSGGRILLNWTIQAATKTATTAFTINSNIGIIKGTATGKFTISGNSTTFTGKANFANGTGAFRGIKATGLSFKGTNTLDGQNGKIDISGKAYY